MGFRHHPALRLLSIVCVASVVCIAWGVAPVRPAGAEDPASGLRQRLDKVLDSRALRGARVGAFVEKADDGSVIYERKPDQRLIPASNAKILTAIAALEVFGPAHRFSTEVYTDAPLAADGEVDNLYVRGAGDPVMNSEDWWRLAADLRSLGVTRVKGAVVVDDAAFDAERWHPSWGTITSRAYHAPIGALTANYGGFALSIHPGAKAGDPVRLSLDPPVSYLRLVNELKTVAPRTRQPLQVTRRLGQNVEIITARGALAAGDLPVTLYRSVLDPGLYAGAVLRLQLAANGIEVVGPARRGRVPAAAEEVLSFEGRSMGEVVRLFMKYSSNPIGETLVKALGTSGPRTPGSWPSGVAAMRAQLLALGLDGESFDLVDGSGLSRDNRVTARLLVHALRTARGSFRIGPEFSASLPIAAEDGTLEKRAGEAAGSLRAKTGLLTGVTGLSGVARLDSGQAVLFSVLANGYRGGDRAAMDALDRFAAELVGTPASSGLASSPR